MSISSMVVNVSWDVRAQAPTTSSPKTTTQRTYCAHTVPTIFTVDHHEPLAKIAFVQVRRTLSSMTTDAFPAGIIPGLQTSPSATGAPDRTHRPVRDGSSETPRGRAMRRAARATAAPIAEPRTHPAITSENQCAPR